MKTYNLNFPKEENIVVTQSGKKTANQLDLAKALCFLFGQTAVEDFLMPILKELNLDTERFFKVFWKHVDRVSLSD